MANPISSKTFFKADLFGGANKGAKNLKESIKSLIQTLEDLKTPLKEAAENSKKFTDNLDLKKIDARKLVQLEKQYQKLKKTLDANEKINTQLKKSKDGLNKVTKEEEKQSKDLLKEKLKQQKADREKKKDLKALITLEEQLGKEFKDQADVLKNLNEISELTGKTRKEQRDISQALRTVVAGLNEEIPEQAEAIERLNGAIDRNDDKIKENADSYLSQKINIGNYGDSVKEALGNTNFFNTGIDQLDGAIQALTGQIVSLVGKISTYDKTTDATADSTRKLTRNNARLAKSFRVVGKALAASGIGLILVALGSLAAAINTNREEALEFQITIAKVSNFFKTLVSRLGAAKDGFFGLFKGIGQAAQGFLSVVLSPLSLLLKTIQAVANGLSQIGIDVQVPEGINNLQEKIEGMQEQGAKAGQTFKDAFEKIFNAFDGTEESVENTTRLIEELLRAQFEFQDTERRIQREIGQTNKLREQAVELAGSDTDSLENIIKFEERSIELAKQELGLKQELAQERLNFANKQLEIELAMLGVTGLEEDQLIDLINTDKQRFQVAETSLQAQQDALAEITELEKEQSILVITGLQRRAKAQSDLFEQNLDFLIDTAERNKQVIESQISDERRAVSTRIQLFEKLGQQIRQDFTNQLGEFNDFADQLADSVEQKLNSGVIPEDFVGDAEEQLRSLRNLDLSFEVDGDELRVFNGDTELTEASLIELNKRLQSLGLSEITINRFKEFLNDGKDAVREYTELGREIDEIILASKELIGEEAISETALQRSKEFNDTLDDLLSGRNISDLTKEQFDELLNRVDRVNKEIENSNEDLEKKNIQNRLEAIDRELEQVEEGSTIEVELEKEKNELLTELDQQALEAKLKNIEEEEKKREEQRQKEIEAEIKKEEQLKRIRQEAFDFVESLGNDQIEKRKERTEEELKINKERQEELQRLAEQGSQNARDNLAFARQEERELLLEKQKNAEAEARFELFLSLLKATQANIDNGDTTGEAIAKAISTGQVLKAAAETLPIVDLPILSNFHGTESVGRDDAIATRNSARDPLLSWVHPNERIIPDYLNSEIPKGLSNKELVKIVNTSIKAPKSVGQSVVVNYPNGIEEEIKGLKEYFPRLASDIDRHTGILTTAIKTGNTIKRNKRRVN